MNSYFDQVQGQIGNAVNRGRHLPWYMRLRYAGRARVLVVVLAALVVATPAVGAATNWFGFGKPLYFQKSSPTLGAGRALAPTSQLLSLRVADPQGGPPWGLRLVHTTRRDVCVQFGRVEDGQLGSLGIDSAWNDDDKFHPFPNTFSGGWGQECGTTDQAGNAFLNIEWGGTASSANPDVSDHGPEAAGCQTTEYEPSGTTSLARHRIIPTGPGTCPPGTSRMVFLGLLGPDATSIIYQAPNGSLQIERTSGSDGAYLLVLPLTQKTCDLYAQGPTSARGSCGNGVESTSDSASPISPGAVRAIHYRDGHTCSLVPPKRLLAGYRRAVSGVFPEGASRPRGYVVSPELQAKLKRAMARFAASQHLSATQLRDKIAAICPAVGYVAPKEKHLTRADVASPITVGPTTTGGLDAGAVISFTARQPVTSSNSWYEFAVTGPARCEADGNGPIGSGNVHTGQRLTERIGVVGMCKGTIRGVVGYMQNSGPTNEETAGSGGTPGQDGSIIVGHFTFTMR
jgi:hypothetical protein